jgi:hypothetical protein
LPRAHPNLAFEGSAEQLRCPVPSSLRSSAPPQRGRWASCCVKSTVTMADVVARAKPSTRLPPFLYGGTLLSQWLLCIQRRSEVRRSIGCTLRARLQTGSPSAGENQWCCRALRKSRQGWALMPWARTACLCVPARVVSHALCHPRQVARSVLWFYPGAAQLLAQADAPRSVVGLCMHPGGAPLSFVVRRLVAVLPGETCRCAS